MSQSPGTQGRLTTPRFRPGVPDCTDGEDSGNLLGTKQAAADRTSAAGGEKSSRRGVMTKESPEGLELEEPRLKARESSTGGCYDCFVKGLTLSRHKL